jgi:plastocyanin
MQLRLLTASAFTVGLAAVFGCGGGGGSTAAPSTTNTNTPTITIVGQNGTQAFTPNPASFGGQQVVFKNNDSVTHHIVLNDGSVDTGDIAPGATSRAVAMPAAGANYHCSIHAGMIGSTAAGGAAPPPCEGIYCSPY